MQLHRCACEVAVATRVRSANSDMLDDELQVRGARSRYAPLWLSVHLAFILASCRHLLEAPA